MLRQLNLAIDARPDASLADFTGPGWMPVIDAVRQLHVGLLPRFYVHGPTGSGKSHFLSAVCQSFEDLGRSAIQVSLRELIEAPTEALTSLETRWTIWRPLKEFSAGRKRCFISSTVARWARVSSFLLRVCRQKTCDWSFPT